MLSLLLGQPHCDAGAWTRFRCEPPCPGVCVPEKSCSCGGDWLGIAPLIQPCMQSRALTESLLEMFLVFLLVWFFLPGHQPSYQ